MDSLSILDSSCVELQFKTNCKNLFFASKYCVRVRDDTLCTSVYVFIESRIIPLYYYICAVLFSLACRL